MCVCVNIICAFATIGLGVSFVSRVTDFIWSIKKIQNVLPGVCFQLYFISYYYVVSI